MSRRALAGAAMVAALVAPAWGRAQPPTESAEGPSAADVATARELFREAATLAKGGEWSAALERYQRSMALRPSPLTRYSIAVAQSHTGALVEASENIRLFVREATPDLDPYVRLAEELLRTIEPRIARLTIELPGSPRGARVLLDGTPIPAAAIGVERPVNPGAHRIEAIIPGHRPFLERVELADGASKNILVAAAREDAGGPAASTSAGTRDHEPEADGSTTGAVLVAVGCTTFVAGGVFGVLGWSKAKDSATPDGDQADKAKAFALVGDIGMGAGLVAAGVGTYLLVSAASAEDRAAVTVVPWTTGSAGGVGVSGAF